MTVQPPLVGLVLGCVSVLGHPWPTIGIRLVMTGAAALRVQTDTYARNGVD